MDFQKIKKKIGKKWKKCKKTAQKIKNISFYKNLNISFL